MHSDDPLLQEILNGITFRLVQPHDPAPGALFDASDLTKAEGYRGFDVANTQFSEPSPLLNIGFLQTPRLSTLACAYIINRLVERMPQGQCYLNIGVWCGWSFFAGIVGNKNKRCIGVDNFSDPISKPHGTRAIFEEQYKRFENPNAHFYAMDYLDYFKTHAQPIGVYFYDGDHAYEHQYQGLAVAHPNMAPGSYALIDDTNWEEPYRATTDFLKEMGGEYSVVFDVKTAGNGHPTFWNGLLIIKKNA